MLLAHCMHLHASQCCNVCFLAFFTVLLSLRMQNIPLLFSFLLFQLLLPFHCFSSLFKFLTASLSALVPRCRLTRFREPAEFASLSPPKKLKCPIIRRIKSTCFLQVSWGNRGKSGKSNSENSQRHFTETRVLKK